MEKVRCKKCRVEFKWTMENDVFGTDIMFEKTYLCNDCIGKLKEWLENGNGN